MTKQYRNLALSCVVVLGFINGCGKRDKFGLTYQNVENEIRTLDDRGIDKMFEMQSALTQVQDFELSKHVPELKAMVSKLKGEILTVGLYDGRTLLVTVCRPSVANCSQQYVLVFEPDSANQFLLYAIYSWTVQ